MTANRYPHNGVDFSKAGGKAVLAELPPDSKFAQSVVARSCMKGDDMGCGAGPDVGPHIHYGTHIQPITPKPNNGDTK